MLVFEPYDPNVDPPNPPKKKRFSVSKMVGKKKQNLYNFIGIDKLKTKNEIEIEKIKNYQNNKIIINKINDKYEAYVEAFKKILGDVKEYLLSKNKFEYKEETSSDARYDAEEEKMTSDMLAELKDFIDKMNLKECDRLIEDYAGRNFGDEMNQKISAIKKAYEMFDFHTVKQLLNETMSLVDIHNP